MRVIEVIIISTICSAITGITILAIWGFGGSSEEGLNDFWENLLLVIIPVLITIGSSKYIVNSWQIQKEKSEIRKKLLEDFDEGYSYVGQYMFELYYKIKQHYVDQSKIKYGSVLTVEEGIVFPDDVNEQPAKVFKDELCKLLEVFSKSNTAQTKFLSSLVLYFDNATEIMKECNISNRFGADLNVLIHQVINSKNKEDFIEFGRLFDDVNKKQHKKIVLLELCLFMKKSKILKKE